MNHKYIAQIHMKTENRATKTDDSCITKFVDQQSLDDTFIKRTELSGMR
jgi:hypothetical protein